MCNFFLEVGIQLRTDYLVFFRNRSFKIFIFGFLSEKVQSHKSVDSGFTESYHALALILYICISAAVLLFGRTVFLHMFKFTPHPCQIVEFKKHRVRGTLSLQGVYTPFDLKQKIKDRRQLYFTKVSCGINVKSIQIDFSVI